MSNKKQQEELLKKLLLLMSYDNSKTLKENNLFVEKIISEASAVASTSPTTNSNWTLLTKATAVKAPSNQYNVQTVVLPAGTNYTTWNSDTRKGDFGFIDLSKNPERAKKVLSSNPFGSWFKDGDLRSFITPDGRSWKFWIDYPDPNNIFKARPLWWGNNMGGEEVWYDEKSYINQQWIPRKVDKFEQVDLGKPRNQQLVLKSSGGRDLSSDNMWFFGQTESQIFINYSLTNLTTEVVTVESAKLLVTQGFKVLSLTVNGKEFNVTTGLPRGKSNALLTLKPNVSVSINAKVWFGEDPETIKQIEKKQKELENQEKQKPESEKSQNQEQKEFPVKIEITDNDKIVVDYSYATKSYQKDIDKRRSQDNSFVLIVITDKGSTGLNVPVRVSEDIADQILLKKYADRVKEGLSMYGGVPVPDGYSPMTYDEVLEINQKLKEINTQYTEKGDDGKLYFKTDTPENIISEYKKLRERLEILKNSGKLTPENKAAFDKKIEEIDAKIKEFEENHKTYHPARQERDGMGPAITIPSSYYFDYNLLSDEQKKEYDLLKENRAKIGEYYGMDLRTSFEKAIDDYAVWVQLALGVITIIATFGGATPFLTLMYGIDVAVNVGLAAHYYGRGDTANVVMSLFFAFLPYVHGIYAPIVKFFAKTPAPEVALKLANLLAKQTFRTAEDVQIFRQFLKTTDEAMLEMFDAGLRMPRSMIGTVLEMGMEAIKSANKVASTSLKAGLWTGTVVKGILKFIPTLAADIVLLKSAQKGVDKIIEAMNEWCKVENKEDCNFGMTSEEYEKSKTYLQKLNEAEAIALSSIIGQIDLMVRQRQMSGEEGKEVVTSLVTGKIGVKIVQEKGIEIAKKTQEGMIDEYSKPDWNAATNRVLEEYRKSKNQSQTPSETPKTQSDKAPTSTTPALGEPIKKIETGSDKKLPDLFG